VLAIPEFRAIVALDPKDVDALGNLGVLLFFQGDYANATPQLRAAVKLRPDCGPANHWISLELEGTRSNRLALNARVKATTGNLVQESEVLSGGSYLSQNDLRIHFGLGAQDHADRVEILWPAGKKEILLNLAADRFYKVKEGKGIVSADVSRLSPTKQE